MSSSNDPAWDDRIKRRTRRQRLGAVFTVLIFAVGMFSRCGATRNVPQSEAPVNPVVTGGIDGLEHSVEHDSPLINTASVLFPQHTMSDQGIGDQQKLFMTGLDEITPTNKTVANVTELRSGPSELHEVLDILAPGDEVIVDGQVAHWYRIADETASGQAGFVSGQALAGEFPGVVWATTVTNSGGSDAVNACTGGLTNFTAMSEDLGVPAYAIHSYCGGEPVLKLNVGEIIAIDGQQYRVASRNDFPLFGSTEVMHDLKADAFLQACDLAKGNSRVLGLVKA